MVWGLTETVPNLELGNQDGPLELGNQDGQLELGNQDGRLELGNQDGRLELRIEKQVRVERRELAGQNGQTLLN